MNSALVKVRKDILAVGYKWSGTFDEAIRGDIHHTITTLKKFSDFIPQLANPNQALGISIHDRPDGFTYYAAMEVLDFGPLLEGMQPIRLPANSYAEFIHKKEDDLSTAYDQVAEFFRENQTYKPYLDPEIETYDPLPIKVEIHPYDDVLSERPGFNILIPVQLKKIE
ncbi:GyrI-like domain-containing protein [Alkalicoccobacillus porphyridii]|uniref:AraC effector-binding domain-containing protein n=1 Tax=Alkalicoccobacillus porphyridii TaxID=2597270 RepID=A0A554A114_9BACI|nr:effector binding domain-containing protein [Alkalicoccobacillus porphyridii]TSB47373.1 hypothetical protein FN960_06445 [Alkalicoccobacillus porphyridii]